MKTYDKNYLECRFYIIGDRDVGKKSFIERLLNIPCTSLLRNIKAEKYFKDKITKLLKENELSNEEYYIKVNNLDLNHTTKTKQNNISSKKISFKNKEEKKKEKEKEKLSKTLNMKFSPKINIPKNLEEMKNKIMLKSLTKYQVLSNRFTRPPIPEYPSKLFNINKSKIVIKPYYIFPGEEMPEYYLQDSEDINQEYIIEGNPKISLKGVLDDLSNLKNNQMTIINLEKLAGYKLYIYNFFIFLYDLSNFDSFELMKNYFTKIISILNITNYEDNNIICILGNKKDKKEYLDIEQENIFNEFIGIYNNIYIKDISTKPYFNFNKFLYEFLSSILSKYHEKLFIEDNFKSNFESISLNKETFSKGMRKIYDPCEKNPGPIYDTNSLYRYISPNELIEAFHSKNKRFSQKIFENKTGPVLGELKIIKNNLNRTDSQFFGIIEHKAGLLNPKPKGFSFGIVGGKFNLMKSRKEMINEINKNIRNSFEDDNVLYNLNSQYISKENNYFDNVKERKKDYLNKKSTKNKEKNEKLIEIIKNNLKKLKEKEEEKKNIIIKKLNLTLYKSSSTPNIISSSNENRENQNYKEHLTSILYPNNQLNITKYKEKRNYIINNYPTPSTPAPNAYNISRNLLNPQKGKTILERHKLETHSKEDPQFPKFKDEFDLIVEKGQKTMNLKLENEKNLFKQKINMIKGNTARAYKNIKIWERWDKNRKNIIDFGHVKKFIDYRKRKLEIQKENKEKIEKEYEELSNALLFEKGHGESPEIKSINYSLVEESSPKYSIKGRNIPRSSSYDTDLQKLFLNENKETFNAFINDQMTRPLPDFNYVKPNIPNIVFAKENRFERTKKYIGSDNLFKDGIFSPKTQEYFFKKEFLSNMAKRTNFADEKVSPSPAEYKIKGQFETIAEKGKKISENRIKIRNKEINKKENKDIPQEK